MIDAPPRQAAMRRRPDRSGAGRGGADAIEQLGSSDERHAKARHRQQHSAIARIVLHVVDTALDGANRDRVGDEERLQARLDRKQSA
jgi:hypothetical protein